ncbi:hypothetical protein BKA69DRAFT_1081734 [Paraphysoderma sedebokerense]|nr:hypothetical protein BKA69DRAFT_1081734 [Paraphysoderma sedebokerense]
MFHSSTKALCIVALFSCIFYPGYSTPFPNHNSSTLLNSTAPQKPELNRTPLVPIPSNITSGNSPASDTIPDEEQDNSDAVVRSSNSSRLSSPQIPVNGSRTFNSSVVVRSSNSSRLSSPQIPVNGSRTFNSSDSDAVEGSPGAPPVEIVNSTEPSSGSPQESVTLSESVFVGKITDIPTFNNPNVTVSSNKTE